MHHAALHGAFGFLAAGNPVPNGVRPQLTRNPAQVKGFSGDDGRRIHMPAGRGLATRSRRSRSPSERPSDRHRIRDMPPGRPEQSFIIEVLTCSSTRGGSSASLSATPNAITRTAAVAGLLYTMLDGDRLDLKGRVRHALVNQPLKWSLSGSSVRHRGGSSTWPRTAHAASSTRSLRRACPRGSSVTTSNGSRTCRRSRSGWKTASSSSGSRRKPNGSNRPPSQPSSAPSSPR